MTTEQYDRWKDFALRMARSAFRRRRRPGTHEILAMVEEFFNDIDGGGGGGCYDMQSILAVTNWDGSPEYPEGHRYREREYRETYCGCGGRRRDLGYPDPDCPECHGSGVYRPWKRMGAVCDNITEYDEIWFPAYWHKMEDRHWEKQRERWTGPPHCCIRAGLGAAVKDGSGMGVLGFTVGDLRRMYPEGVPEWLANQWDGGRTIATSAVVSGIGFVPKDHGPCQPFTEMADNAQLWL